MGLLSRLRGDDITLSIDAENRALTSDNVPTSWFPYSRDALLTDVTRVNALRVVDAFACVRVLSDAVASLPPKLYRQTTAGRVPVGPDQRLAALLRTPTPGSTSSDLFGLAMVHLNVYGNAYVGKFRGPDGEVVQLGCIHPDRVMPVLNGGMLRYRVDGDDSYTVRDIVHVKAMPDPLYGGILGMSPVANCRLALSLSASLMESTKQYFENGSRPSGIVTLPEGTSPSGEKLFRERWRSEQGLQASKMHSIAVVTGSASFQPIGFSADDSQFLQQRELSAREVARVFGVPGWMIGAGTGDSLTYSTVLEQNRFFVTHSLRPWLVRLERAFSNDPELAPGGVYLEFDLDALLRADLATRSEIYQRALGDDKHPGWMTVNEVRELENLAPQPTPPPAPPPITPGAPA